MLAARALLQLFEKSTIRVVGTRQNQENFQKTHFWKKNFFEAFEEFPTKFLIFILWILMILGFRKLESWKTAIDESRSRSNKKAAGRFLPSIYLRC